MQYDGNWTISIAPGSPLPAAASWPVLSNGGVAIVPCYTPSAGLGTSRCVLGSPPNSRQYGSPVDTFDFMRVRVTCGSADLDQAFDGQRLSLDMQLGVLSIGCTDAATGCRVLHEVRTLMHMPGFVMHTLAITPAPGATLVSPLTLTHELQAPRAFPAAATKFSGDSVSDGRGAQFLFRGEATDGSACESVYLLDAPTLLTFAGYNEQRHRGRAWATLSATPPDAPSASISFHVLTATTTSGTSDVSRARVRRDLLASDASSVIAAHESAWARRWVTRIDVSGSGVDALVRGALRYAFYNVHSCVRPGGSSAAAVDLAGTTFASGRGNDALCNLLVLVSPAAARPALEARFEQLGEANEAAEARGLSGSAALLPHADEDGADPFEPTSAGKSWRTGPKPVAAHATSTTAVDAWNYFRATRDLDWLRTRGYALLSSAAEALCGLAVCPDPDTDPSAFRLPGVAALLPHGYTSSQTVDRTLAVVAAAACLKAATEAAFALGLTPPERWTTVRFGMTIFRLPGGQLAAEASPSAGGALPVPEPVIALSDPLMSFVGSDLGLSVLSVPTNLAFWINADNRLVAPETTSPYARVFSDLALLQASAQAASLNPSKIGEFQEALDGALQQHCDAGNGYSGGSWGNLRPAGGPTAAPNDLGLSAQLLLAFLQGLCGLRLQGGYTAVGDQYATPGLNASASAPLPTGWDRITISGFGLDQATDLVLLNRATLVNPSGGQGVFVPWSTEALTL